MSINVAEIRKEFDIFTRDFHGKRVAYLDSAATTLKPRSVVETVSEHFAKRTANIHRGVYQLSEEATADFESTRDLVQHFINARDRAEVIFTSGTTESINLISSTFGRMLKEGDEIILTNMEHHSNIVPWQILALEKKIKIKVLPISDKGELEIEKLESLVTDRTKLISFVWVSNSLGTINPVQKICDFAREKNIRTLIDAAQAATFLEIDVQKLGCDFMAFSAHKMFGPTGVGVLYGRKPILSELPPYKGGGDMIRSVSFSGTTYNDLPYKFEAGTPNIAGVIGFGAAIKFIKDLGIANIRAHDQKILKYANERFARDPDIKIYGQAKEKGPVISFWLGDAHPHDVGTLLDQDAIAVRTGHHCTQPVMERFGIPATVRASFSVYSDEEDVDRLVGSLKKISGMFK
jgi:cysteine desulfurase / selenocysteine lyase